MRRALSEVPAGWEFNPSARAQRAPLVLVGILGLVTSLVCMLHARGLIHELWDPFPRVENGWVLHAPVLGGHEIDSICFALILALALTGRSDRWRSHPWLPVVTALVALGEASYAVVRWSLAYSASGATGTLSTIATACAIAALPMSADEAFAAFVQRRRTRRRVSPYRDIAGPRGERIGVRVKDWTDYLAGGGAIVVGTWLLMAVLPPRAERDAHLLGAYVIAFGALSLVQVARIARWANLALGAWLLVAPLAHDYTLRGTIHFIVAGLILLMLSVFADPISRDDSSHARHA